MASDLYGDFLYGDGFYGIDIQPSGPEASTNLYVIREPFYSILKWDAPQYNGDGSVCTPVRYLIYRTSKTNKTDVTLIKTLSTVDFNGNVDTCYVDQLTGTDPAKDYFYSVICVNSQLIAGLPSDYAIDIFTNKDTRYNNTNIYTKYKNNEFFKLLEDIPPSPFFDTEYNILPYILKNGYLIVDFFTGLGAGTTLSVYVNDQLQGKNINNDYFYFVIPATTAFPYSNGITIDIRDSVGTTTYKSYHVKTYNYLLFLQSLAGQLTESKVDANTLQNDLYTSDVRLEKIYDMFGFPFEFKKPAYLTAEEYRFLVLGGGLFPGLYTSFLNYGGTYKGIKDVVKSITGASPTISTFRDADGWVVFSGLTTLDSGNVSTATVNSLTVSGTPWTVDEFVGDTVSITGGQGLGQTRIILSNTTNTLTTTAAWDLGQQPDLSSTYAIYDTASECWVVEPSAISETVHEADTFSIPYMDFTLVVSVDNGLKVVVNEPITSTAELDYVDGTNIITGIAVKDSYGHVYTQTVDYDADLDTGKITWLAGGTKPSVGSMIYCSYSFLLRDIIEHMVNLVKQAHYKILVDFYGFGTSEFGEYPFGEP
jgi:hypothetical protein